MCNFLHMLDMPMASGQAVNAYALTCCLYKREHVGGAPVHEDPLQHPATVVKAVHQHHIGSNGNTSQQGSSTDVTAMTLLAEPLTAGMLMVTGTMITARARMAIFIFLSVSGGWPCMPSAAPSSTVARNIRLERTGSAYVGSATVRSVNQSAPPSIMDGTCT